MLVLITKLYNNLKESCPENATTILHGMLLNDEITATASDPQNDDNVIDLDSIYWKSMTAEQAEKIFMKGIGIFKVPMASDTVDFRMNVFVPSWTLDILPVKKQTPQAATTSNRGPKPTYDWSVVWTGAAYLMSQQKKPKHLEDLIQDVAAWCDEHFGEGAAPGETVLKDNFSGLFRLIAGESPKTIFPNGVKPKRKRKKP
jgi:hypothetical protein